MSTTPSTIELRIDVSRAVSLPGPLRLAATVFVPANVNTQQPVSVIFAVPGGGYSRGYFAMSFPGHVGYNEAEHHAACGRVFVAVDHLGVGDSSIPDLGTIDFSALAAAYDSAVRQICTLLQQGKVDPGVPAIPRIFTVGMGQSMGGCVSILTQGRHATFDAIAPLGYSAIHTTLPQRSKEAYQRSVDKHSSAQGKKLDELDLVDSSSSVEDFVYPFHWEDVPQDILDADMVGGYPIRKQCPPWGSATVPNSAMQMMVPGAVKQEAASVKVPVFIGLGERDTAPVPHAEPSAYSGSNDVTLCIVPRMAHMHNFAGTRHQLWMRFGGWVDALTRCASVNKQGQSASY